MPRAKSAVSQSELMRYLKALRAVGYDDWRIEVAKPDGTKVSIFARESGEAAAADDGDVFDRMIARLP